LVRGVAPVHMACLVVVSGAPGARGGPGSGKRGGSCRDPPAAEAKRVSRLAARWEGCFGVTQGLVQAYGSKKGNRQTGITCAGHTTRVQPHGPGRANTLRVGN
jgi:hypothetical protein